MSAMDSKLAPCPGGWRPTLQRVCRRSCTEPPCSPPPPPSTPGPGFRHRPPSNGISPGPPGERLGDASVCQSPAITPPLAARTGLPVAVGLARAVPGSQEQYVLFGAASSINLHTCGSSQVTPEVRSQVQVVPSGDGPRKPEYGGGGVRRERRKPSRG